MAEIVLGIGTSHSPLLTLPPSEWHNRARVDLNNMGLTLADGSVLSYEELVARRGERYADVAVEQVFVKISSRCQAQLDQLALEIERAAPDVVVIVGDDQSELYRPGNMPAFAIFCGDEIATHPFKTLAEWAQPVAEGYAMDRIHRFPGAADLALKITAGLIEREIDVAIASDVPDPENFGFGHAFGFPIKRLYGGRTIPTLPVMLNTYYQPNVPTAARCLQIGRSLRAAIEAIPDPLRIAVLASGGLSHFVVEEELDRLVMDNLADPHAGPLGSIPRTALLEGSSEILNWIVTAGAVDHLPLQHSAYEPIRRTPAGTGIGAAFATWRN